MARSQQRRGPKGYQRSDERLKEDICERLMTRWDIDSSEVSVEVASGKVTLEGTVPDRRMRHAIEDLIDDCHGVQDIENHLRMQSSSTSGSASESRGSQYSQSGQGGFGSQETGGSQQGQSGGSSTSSGGQQNQASQTAAQSGQDSSTGATLGSTTRSSAPARSASSEKKDT